MFLFLYRFFCGYLYVRVTAKNPEKILNLCAARSIPIWRVSTKNKNLYFKIGIGSFKSLRVLKRNIPAKIHITKKVGFPFFVAKNKKRYGMPIGIILFFVILNFFSGFVWNICISGNENIANEDIDLALRKIGIYEGAKISDIDPEEKRYELLLNSKGLSWAAINIEGSMLTVDLVETKRPDLNEKAPSNIKATDDGIIRKLMVKKGVSKVKIGDSVRKGDLLVSGIYEYEDGSFEFKRSYGNVYAEVDYNFTVSQPLKVKEFLKTGQVERRSVLNIFGLNIPLFLGNVKEPFILKEQSSKTYPTGSYLPIRKITKNFYKTKETTYVLSEEKGLERAKESAEKKIKELCPTGEIIYRKDEIEISNDELIIKVEIKCLKDIALEEKIQLDTSN